MKITSLLFTAFIAIAAQSAQAEIYKCTTKGKTIYSEAPCAVNGGKQSELEIDNSRMGNVTYDRETINAVRARIREGMNETGVVVSTGTNKPASNSTCDMLNKQIKDLDDRARQPLSAWEQDYIRKEKTRAQQSANGWNC